MKIEPNETNMDHLGIEPRTNQLKAEYSTIELVIPGTNLYTI